MLGSIFSRATQYPELSVCHLKLILKSLTSKNVLFSYFQIVIVADISV